MIMMAVMSSQLFLSKLLNLCNIINKNDIEMIQLKNAIRYLLTDFALKFKIYISNFCISLLGWRNLELRKI